MHTSTTIAVIRQRFLQYLAPMGFSIVGESVHSDDPGIYHETIVFQRECKLVQISFGGYLSRISVYLFRVKQIGTTDFTVSFDLRALRKTTPDLAGSLPHLAVFGRDLSSIIEDDLNLHLSILKDEGTTWLNGDHSREPYIRKSILPGSISPMPPH